MSLVWLDAKYISLISFRLRNFKRRGSNLWNFSCPFCMDSKTDKRKARGYIFQNKGKLIYKCHNCNVPVMDVPHFIQRLDQTLYEDYTKEKLLSTGNQKDDKEHEEFVRKLSKPTFWTKTPLKVLPKISQLSADHPAKQFVEKRKIPTSFHYKLFLCLKFKAFVNLSVPGKFESIENDEPRLIIPLLNENKELVGFQGRSFKKKTPMRYITIMLSDGLKLYGLDEIDKNKHIYIVEGPIDSMFLPNALASAGGDIVSEIQKLDISPDNFTVIYDNEPRNKETCEKIEKAINKGYPVCLWPSDINEKDINDMILSGKTSQDIVDIINENTYIGLSAKLHMASWRRT